jgi:hypothetical protein
MRGKHHPSEASGLDTQSRGPERAGGTEAMTPVRTQTPHARQCGPCQHNKQDLGAEAAKCRPAGSKSDNSIVLPALSRHGGRLA